MCVDYVGRDGVADMREVVGRLATAATLPLVLDSTEPAVIEAGLELTGGRAVINSVNYEDGDGPDSRIARVMPLVREHGAAVIALTIDEQGQARTAEWKVAVAERLIADLTGNWGMRVEDIIVDCLTFPIATGQEETRRDAIETIEAIAELKRRHPAVQTTLGISNVSFGLKPAARAVLNSVFLAECVRAGLDSAIVHAARIVPIARIPDEQRQVALDLVYDRRREGYDPLARLLELFEGVDAAGLKASRAAELAALPLWDRLKRRIIDGERSRPRGRPGRRPGPAARPGDRQRRAAGRHEDGRRAVRLRADAAAVRADLRRGDEGVRRPTSSRTWPAADEAGKGKIVLATVKGDVHDIGKNLVDIILSNNGYDVVNIGIKQPISSIVTAAEENDADVIGMSGLLVKSTVVMRDNLAELNSRGLAGRWPVLLGGAALTRAYVEQDLASLFDGEVRYARDAFEGLRLMDAAMAVKRGEPGAKLPELRTRRVRAVRHRRARRPGSGRHGPFGRINRCPGAGAAVPRHRSDQGHPAGRVRRLPGRAGAVHGPVGAQAVPRRRWAELRGTGRDRGPAAAAHVAGAGADRRAARGGCGLRLLPLRQLGKRPDRARTEDGMTELERFTFPRQRRDRRLCLADFFKPPGPGPGLRPTWWRSSSPPWARGSPRPPAELFAKNAYREYLELHGLSVQLTEALAEYWHTRIRRELGIGGADPDDLDGFFRVGYRGARYSFGYPACPDLADRAKVVRLLEPSRIGVELSEEMQLHPEQSTDAIVVHHPEAKYFSV